MEAGKTHEHSKDSDCTVDPRTSACTECGAGHADPCLFCSQRAYHSDWCETMHYKAPTLESELEGRLRDLLDKFDDHSDATTYTDDGIDGHGVTMRLIYAGRMIEINATIKDVTEELTTTALGPKPSRRRIQITGCALCHSGGPPHDASPNCESGKRAHCSCDVCF